MNLHLVTDTYQYEVHTSYLFMICLWEFEMFRTLIFIFILHGSVIGQDLQQDYRDIVNPVIGPQVELGSSLRIGGFGLNLTKSTKAWQLLANGKPCGVIIDGGHNFRFRMTGFGAPVAKRNVSSAAKTLKKNMRSNGQQFEVWDELSRAVIWTWDLSDLPIIEGEPPPKKLLNWLDRLLPGQYDHDPGIELLHAQHSKSKDVALAIVKTKTGQYLYSMDPLKDKEQKLYVMVPLKSLEGIVENDLKNSWTTYRLATQPIGRKVWETTPATLMSVHTELDINHPQKNELEVTATITLKAITGSVNIWRVNLLSEVRHLQKKIWNNVVEVTINGQTLSYTHHNGELLVLLDRTYKKGETLKVRVVSKGDIAIKTMGHTYWSTANMAWYPQGDLNGEFSTFDFKLRIPKKFKVLLPGEVQETSEDNTHRIIVSKVTTPTQHPFIAVGRIYFKTEERDGRELTVASLGTAYDNKYAAIARNVFYGSSSYFEAMYAMPPAFKSTTVSYVSLLNDWNLSRFIGNRASFERGNTSQFFESKRAPLAFTKMNPSLGVTPNLIIPRLRYPLSSIHPAASAYWSHMIMPNSDHELWLNHALTNYSTITCMKRLWGDKREDLAKTLIKQFEGESKKADRASLYLINDYSYFMNNGDYTTKYVLLMKKGATVIHAIRGELQQKYGVRDGDQKFYMLLRNFLANFKYRWGTTQSFIQVLNQQTGDDWQPYFEKYVYGTEIPKVKTVL